MRISAMTEPLPTYQATIPGVILEPPPIDREQVKTLRRAAIACVRACDDMLGWEQTIEERVR